MHATSHLRDQENILITEKFFTSEWFPFIFIVLEQGNA